MPQPLGPLVAPTAAGPPPLSIGWPPAAAVAVGAAVSSPPTPPTPLRFFSFSEYLVFARFAKNDNRPLPPCRLIPKLQHSFFSLSALQLLSFAVFDWDGFVCRRAWFWRGTYFYPSLYDVQDWGQKKNLKMQLSPFRDMTTLFSFKPGRGGGSNALMPSILSAARTVLGAFRVGLSQINQHCTHDGGVLDQN